MNSLMASRLCGRDGWHSVVSSLLLVASAVDAVCGGGRGKGVTTIWFFDCRDQIVLSSIQMMSPASFGVNVTVTGAAVVDLTFSGRVTAMGEILVPLRGVSVELGLLF